MLDALPSMIWKASTNAECTYVNRTWLTYRGRELEDELGDGWLQALHPDDTDAFLACFREHANDRQPFEIECRMRRSDGEFRYVRFRALSDESEDGTHQDVVGDCTDIDAHHVRDVTASDFFDMTLDNACIAGFDGYFKQVNPSWTRTLGWSEEELLSRPIIDLVHPDDRDGVLEARERLRSSGQPLELQTNRYRCKDGSYRWFEWRSVSHQESQLVYALARDITEARRAKQQLREARDRETRLERQLAIADRLASVGTLAAGVAHEINNPLAFVIGNLAFISEQVEHHSGIHEWASDLGEVARDAREGAERIAKIVGALKTFSSVEETLLATTDIEPVIEMSIDIAMNEIRHRARLVRCYEDCPPVEVDESRLGQVFVNLLINAAQAIPPGNIRAHEIRVATSTDEQGLAVIEIEDSGEGIPESQLVRIFDPFYTTKSVGAGTGLGLSLCHNVISGLDGEITVTSEPGVGTSVRVVLPPAESEVPSKTWLSGSDNKAKEHLTGAKILVVDDEPAVGRLLRRALGDHDVTTVEMARHALDLIEAGHRFHVILSDVMMPTMSGIQFHTRLSERFPDLAERVVFVSGGAFTHPSRTVLRELPNVVLDKPFDLRELERIVQTHAHRYG